MVKFSSAIKKSEFALFARRWIELEIIVESEINQTQKTKYHMLSFFFGSV